MDDIYQTIIDNWELILAAVALGIALGGRR